MSIAFGSGEAYEPLMGRWSRLIAPKFVRWVRIPSVAFVLDVGCGTGALSEALLAYGANRIVGVDPSPSYVAYARSRFSREGNNITFEEGDAMQLRFSDASFDAVLSGLVLNFIPDPAKGVAEMRRVARQGGIVAAYVWDYGEKMGLTRQFWDAAKSLDPSAHSLDEGVRFAICRPERLRELFEQSDLTEVLTGPIEQEMVFRDFDDYWRPILGGQGPVGGYVMGLSEKRREELRRELHRRLSTRRDGQIHLEARAWAVRGIKPNS